MSPRQVLGLLGLAAFMQAAAAQGAAASVANGAQVFSRYCVTCHGAKADGTGAAAKLYRPAPANLRLSTRSDDYKFMIIRGGGASMGRSPSMPPWGQELSEEQIRDVVGYLRTVRANAGTQ